VFGPQSQPFGCRKAERGRFAPYLADNPAKRRATQPIFHRLQHICRPVQPHPQNTTRQGHSRQIGPPRLGDRQMVLHPQYRTRLVLQAGQNKPNHARVGRRGGKHIGKSPASTGQARLLASGWCGMKGDNGGHARGINQVCSLFVLYIFARESNRANDCVAAIMHCQRRGKKW